MQRRSFFRAGLAATAGVAAAMTPGASAIALDPHAFSTRRRADGVLRLASNENALGLSDGARRAAVEAMVDANRYTHDVARLLVAKLAAHHGVSPQAVVLGNGSTEVLQMAVHAVARPGGRLVVADPTFEHPEAYARPFGIDVVKVPLTRDHAHDIGRMRDAAKGARGPVLVCVCNPNNPTGSLTPSADVEAWIHDAPDVLFLVDEAYFEYVDHPLYRSALPLAMERPNVIVVRTFSKIHGMAGLRIGYALAQPETAARIAAFSANSNMNMLGLRAALASLDDAGHQERSLRANRDAARITYAVLDELGLERIPSHANFVMHRIPGDLAEYIRRMREHDIMVGRPFPPMLGHNRLSFGLPDDMARFADVLRAFRRNGWV